MYNVFNAQAVTCAAKELFKEERAKMRVDGWFLAREIVCNHAEEFAGLSKEMRAAKELNVALEVNENSLRKKPGSRINIRENYKTMLRMCLEHDVPVFVSSDAHDPTKVARFDVSRGMLAEAGYDESLVLNTSAEKLWAFLGHQLAEK